MTSFPVALSSPQITTLETSGYWARVLCCLNPPEVVFRAQSTQEITDNPFITFTWDNADVGAYTDVWEGMIVYLSSTTDIRDAFYRGRTRLAPSATEFYIDLNASLLNIGTYLIVTRDTDLFARIRTDTLVDGSITFTPLNPQLSGLPSVIVLYDVDNDGTEDFTPVQIGIPVDAAATSIDTWAWDVSGAGASSIDDPTLEHPTFTFEAGFHYLLRVIYTDDQGTSNYQISHVYCVDRTFNSPVVQPVVTGTVSGDLEDGWTANLTAYADVDTLIDRTHCAVWFIQHFGDGSDTPIFSNVLMNGRIRSDSIQTEGSAEAGQVQQVTFAVEGITAYLRRLRIPNDIIRPTASPNEWGEITAPNPYRMACYALWTYSTLTNIASFGVESGAFGAYEIGGQPRGIEGGYSTEVLVNTLDPIKATVNYAPDGSLMLARTVSYVEDRSSVSLIAVIHLDDILTYAVDRDSSRTYAQVIAYGGVFDSVANTYILYTSSAPSIVYGDGGDTLEITREILQTDSSAVDAAIELGLRSSNHYAFSNPKPLLKETYFDSWAGVLIPTNYQRWASVYAASSNTLGIAYTATDYWQLQSVSLTINTDGTIDVSTEKYRETSFEDAQKISAQIPNTLENMNPVMPILPNDPAFPTDPLELYPTDTPDLEDLQPIDPFSGMQAYTPFPPDVAAQIALRQGTAKCKSLAVNFRWTSNVTSSWTTILSTDYLMTVSGSARVSSGSWIQVFNLKSALSPFAVSPPGAGSWSSGAGVAAGDLDGFRQAQIATTIPPSTITSVMEAFNLGKGTFTVVSPVAAIFLNNVLVASINPADITDGTDKTFAWSGLQTGVTDITVQAVASYDNTIPYVYDGSATQTQVVVTGTGTNPFTGDPGGDIYVDAFYQWNLDEDGNEINVSLIPGGLYLDNTKYTPVPAAPFPPFSKNHQYANLPFAGTNNPLSARMVMDNANAQNVYLDILMCRKT